MTRQAVFGSLLGALALLCRGVEATYCTSKRSYYPYNTYLHYCSDSCCGSSEYEYCCYSYGSSTSVYLGVGAIIGIIVGVIILISVVVALICCCVKAMGKSGSVVRPQGQQPGTRVTVLHTGSPGYPAAGPGHGGAPPPHPQVPYPGPAYGMQPMGPQGNMPPGVYPGPAYGMQPMGPQGNMPPGVYPGPAYGMQPMGPQGNKPPGIQPPPPQQPPPAYVYSDPAYPPASVLNNEGAGSNPAGTSGDVP